MNLFSYVIPELILVVAAGILCLMGVARSAAVRKIVPFVALGAVLLALASLLLNWGSGAGQNDAYGTFRLTAFSEFVKGLTLAVAALFVLLSWPTDDQGFGNASLQYGRDAGEYFGLMLLAVTGVLVVSGANDLIVLFMGIELASIPTYVMVAMSRPLPAAQEAGVKYFFLGAMSAAVMLFGFSYLYGVTGTTNLHDLGLAFASPTTGAALGYPDGLRTLAVVMLIVGFGFKIAAVPLHLYAGDVYQGAATPVTALLSFIPKVTGMVALVKVLLAAGGNQFAVPHQIVTLLWVLAALTMTVGNALALLQFNVKRVLAYSSIAHTGYMLVGVTAMVAAGGAMVPEMVPAGVGRAGLTAAAAADVRAGALNGVLFYLAAYGVMNVAAFGVMMMLPTRRQFNPADPGAANAANAPATTAETYEELAGQGRAHPLLGLAMAVGMFSLAGLPLTVGFWGKIYLIRPAFAVGTVQMNWLGVILVANAAVSAAYYLKIVATMFLRPLPDEEPGREIQGGSDVAAVGAAGLIRSLPVALAVSISAVGVLLLGALPPAIQALSLRTGEASRLVQDQGMAVPPGLNIDNVDDPDASADAATPPSDNAPVAAVSATQRRSAAD